MVSFKKVFYRKKISYSNILPFAAIGLLVIFSCGCSTTNIKDTVIGPDYVPSNIYTNPAPPMKLIKRVAVLPITTTVKEFNDDYIRKQYQSVVLGELIKAKRFEIQEITPETLRELTGKREWTAEEKLPTDFFTRIRDIYGCEAILFIRLTVYKPYPPVAFGWNWKLVECDSARILWSADEVFNGGDNNVSNSARRFYQNHLAINMPGIDSGYILRTPRYFCQYSAFELACRIPIWKVSE